MVPRGQNTLSYYTRQHTISIPCHLPGKTNQKKKGQKRMLQRVFWVQNWSYFEWQLPQIITFRHACMEVANRKPDFEKKTYFHAQFSQIWLIPLVEDHHSTYLTKLEKQNPYFICPSANEVSARGSEVGLLRSQGSGYSVGLHNCTYAEGIFGYQTAFMQPSRRFHVHV